MTEPTKLSPEEEAKYVVAEIEPDHPACGYRVIPTHPVWGDIYEQVARFTGVRAWHNATLYAEIRNLVREWDGRELLAENRRGAVDERLADILAPLKAKIAELEQRIDDMCVALKAGCDREWKDESPEAIAVIAANAIHWRGKRAEAAEARVKELEAENEKVKAEFIKSLIDRGTVDWERIRVRVAELQKREGKR